MSTTKWFVGHVWHAGQPRQIPATFRTKARRFRARIFWREANTALERLCEHEHVTEAEAYECAVAMAAAANEATV